MLQDTLRHRFINQDSLFSNTLDYIGNIKLYKFKEIDLIGLLVKICPRSIRKDHSILLICDSTNFVTIEYPTSKMPD